MNRGQIRSLTRIWLGEATEGFWLDSELNTLIDLANAKLNQKIRAIAPEYFSVSKTFQTQANVKSYAWPSDFAGLIRLEHYSTANPTKDIVQIKELVWPEVEAPEINTAWPYTQTGKPEAYVPFGDHFDLLPIPDATYPIRMYFEQVKANLIDDGATPSSPSEFHDMIAIWATILALPKNQEDVSTYAGMWEARSADLEKALRIRKSSGPELMSLTLPTGGIKE